MFFAEDETLMKPIMCAWGFTLFRVLLFRNGIFHPSMLSAVASHPLAERGDFFGMWDEGRSYEVSNLCVCGDFVAGVSRIYFISVWNWKTGQLVSDQVRISN
jgi:hypothetical protein